jgi:hypothetical protein
MFGELVPADLLTRRRWGEEEGERMRGLMKVVDQINAKFGGEVRQEEMFNSQGTWKTRFGR